MSEHKWRPGQRERLADLLGRFGNSILTTEQFWSQMRQAGLDDSHIDRFCSEEAHWTPDAGSSDDDLPGIRDTGLDEPHEGSPVASLRGSRRRDRSNRRRPSRRAARSD